MVGATRGRARELRKRDHRHVQLRGQALERARNCRHFLLAAGKPAAPRHQLQVIDHDQVQALFHNGHEAAGQRGPIWRELRQSLAGRVLAEGDVLIVGDPALGLRLEVLHPPRAANEEEAAAWTGNEASLILRLTRHGQGLALFTGDAERRSLRRLLASGRDLRAQVLLAPHHGSDRSFLAAFYKAVQPELVLASCGFQNRYNYPGSRLRAWLARHGIPLLHTGESGQISVSWPWDGPMRVRAVRPH